MDIHRNVALDYINHNSGKCITFCDVFNRNLKKIVGLLEGESSDS